MTDAPANGNNIHLTAPATTDWSACGDIQPKRQRIVLPDHRRRELLQAAARGVPDVELALRFGLNRKQVKRVRNNNRHRLSQMRKHRITVKPKPEYNELSGGILQAFETLDGRATVDAKNRFWLDGNLVSIPTIILAANVLRRECGEPLIVYPCANSDERAGHTGPLMILP